MADSMTHKTGERAPMWGAFGSDCGCWIEAVLRWGEVFPPCATHGSTTWYLLRPYRPSQEEEPHPAVSPPPAQERREAN